MEDRPSAHLLKGALSLLSIHRCDNLFWHIPFSTPSAVQLFRDLYRRQLELQWSLQLCLYCYALSLTAFIPCTAASTERRKPSCNLLSFVRQLACRPLSTPTSACSAPLICWLGTSALSALVCSVRQTPMVDRHFLFHRLYLDNLTKEYIGLSALHFRITGRKHPYRYLHVESMLDYSLGACSWYVAEVVR